MEKRNNRNMKEKTLWKIVKKRKIEGRWIQLKLKESKEWRKQEIRDKGSKREREM